MYVRTIGYAGAAFFCLQVIGGIFIHYRLGIVAIGGWFEKKLGIDNNNMRDKTQDSLIKKEIK